MYMFHAKLNYLFTLLYAERILATLFLYQPDIVTMKQNLLGTLYEIQAALASRVLHEGKCHK